MSDQNEYFRMAAILEQEAERLRMLVTHEHNKSTFERNLEDEAKETVKSFGHAHAADDADIRMVRAIALGKFEVRSVFGGGKPIDSDDVVEEFARGLTLAVNGQTYPLSYNTLVDDEGHHFDGWDEGMAPTKAFVEAHPLAAEMLTYVLDKCHEDFHEFPSPMGNKAYRLEVMLRERLGEIDAEQKQSLGMQAADGLAR